MTTHWYWFQSAMRSSFASPVPESAKCESCASQNARSARNSRIALATVEKRFCNARAGALLMTAIAGFVCRRPRSGLFAHLSFSGTST